MKKNLLAVLLFLVTLPLLSADASAMYNPATGTFMQRDPGPGGMMHTQHVGTAGPAEGDKFLPRDPTGQYQDGMSLYDAYFVPNRTDPQGLLGQYIMLPEGGSCSCCGPDVTAWLVDQMNVNLQSLMSVQQFLSPLDYAPLMGYYLYQRMGTGKIWDYKNIMNFSAGDCPSLDCQGTVTLCKHCFQQSITGDINFGYLANAAGFGPMRWGAANFAHIKSSWTLEPLSHQRAINIGDRLYDQDGNHVKEADLCSLIEANHDGLDENHDCNPCFTPYKAKFKEIK